ncbi:MAG: transposon-encoded TnpW family protein, partial [Clostridiales bacterium]|nr:transposon-encoded TnpW family protein [Clostridiales bacterium]
MNNEETNLEPKKETEAEHPDLVKQIGKTTYRVKVHFSKTRHETMSDKIKRMLRD